MFDQYIGDGVYASHDGYYLWLDLRGQDSTTRIGLEPSVFEALIDYKKYAEAQWALKNQETAREDESAEAG